MQKAAAAVTNWSDFPGTLNSNSSIGLGSRTHFLGWDDGDWNATEVLLGWFIVQQQETPVSDTVG